MKINGPFLNNRTAQQIFVSPVNPALNRMRNARIYFPLWGTRN